MPEEQKERPRPHGDPLEETLGSKPADDLINSNPEENAGQRQSDAQPDTTLRGDPTED